MEMPKKDQIKMIEREIVASKAAIKSHEEGLIINKIVLRAFETELQTFK